MAAAAAQLSW